MTPDGYRQTVLGRTKAPVCRLGMAASYGVPAAAVERAFEQGVNYLFWGSFRRAAFGQAIRNLARHRDKLVIVVQSYSPFGALIAPSVERALSRVRLDYADVLLLGMWNRPVPPRVVDACRRLKERGLVRLLGFSTHRRTLIPESAPSPDFDVFHVRYNAVHTGAERDVFPLLPAENGPGVVSFTATCWGQLLSHGRGVPRSERLPAATDCYRFVMSNPAVHVCLSGPANEGEARAAVEALHRGPMDPEELAWMRRVGAAIYRR